LLPTAALVRSSSSLLSRVRPLRAARVLGAGAPAARRHWCAGACHVARRNRARLRPSRLFLLECMHIHLRAERRPVTMVRRGLRERQPAPVSDACAWRTARRATCWLCDSCRGVCALPPRRASGGILLWRLVCASAPAALRCGLRAACWCLRAACLFYAAAACCVTRRAPCAASMAPPPWQDASARAQLL
jgi:hypothetical protein